MAFDYYASHGGKPIEMSGIDFKEPVHLVNLRKGDRLIQYNRADPKTGLPIPGSYYAPPGTPASMLGIDSSKYPLMSTFEVTKDTSLTLMSTAANLPLSDPFAPGAKGGGTQFYNPDRSLGKIIDSSPNPELKNPERFYEGRKRWYFGMKFL